MVSTSLLASEGVQKALSFLVLAVFGNRLKQRFTAAQISGVQKLILDGLLPCVIFKALCSVELDAALAKWPVLGAAFVVVQLAGAAVVTKLLCRNGRRRTALVQLGTAAPGLSAVVFVREFVGDAAAGKAALFDLPMKLYLIFAMPAVLKALGEGRARAPAKPTTLASVLGDPLNAGILGGLLMALSGTPYASLGPAARAVDALAAAQSPVLFVLIGLKLDLAGATPAICGALLLGRHAVAYAAYAAVYHGTAALADADDALIALLMIQAAVSVVGWSQMSKAADAGVKGYDLDFAFDIVGYSMPLTMALQTVACLSDPTTVARSAAARAVLCGSLAAAAATLL